MSGSVYRPEGRRICGGTGRGQTHDVCDGSGLQSMSFWEESLKGSPRRTLLGCKRRGKESSGFWRRQIPLPFKELIEPNKFASEHFSIWSIQLSLVSPSTTCPRRMLMEGS